MRYKMGDLNPSDESLVFYKYRGEKERWVSHKWLKEQRLRAAKSNRAHYKKNKEYYVDKTQKKRKTRKTTIIMFGNLKVVFAVITCIEIT